VFSNRFGILISKINFKIKKKYYFNIFLNKNILKNDKKKGTLSRKPAFS
jgi:hypothetical protein